MRAIRRPSEHEAVVRLLAESPHPASQRSIFPTMRDLICFAAVLGFNEGVRTPLTGPTAEIDGRTFESSPAAIDLMYLLGLASERDAVILQNEHEDALITAFEEYAATGLLTISSWLNEKPDDEHGDQALLAALRRHGFLDSSRTTIDSVVDQVAF